VATTNGISLAPDNLEEEVAHLMAQELPYTVFDTDTEVAVASMLNAKLEFDEALLTENVALHCGAQGGRGEVEGIVQDADMQVDNRENFEDEDSSRYLKFSRTVVCDAASSSETSGQLTSTQSISQLDGADGGSESDESEVVDDDARDPEGEEGENKLHANHITPTKRLTVALKRLEPIFTVSKSAEPEFQGSYPPSEILEEGYGNDEMSFQEEVVQMSSEAPTPPDKVFLDSSTGHFISAEDGTVVGPEIIAVANKDDSSSSTDSIEGFKDDLTDPDYSPECTPFPERKTKRSPTSQMKTIIVKTKRPVANFKRLSPKPFLPQQRKLKLILPPRPNVTNASTSPAAATVCVIPRSVTSSIVINGLNVPIQPGVSTGRTIAIRLDNSRTGSQQQVATPNQAAASSSPTPAPQVLLVNRHGQILIKDPRSNTYQPLSTNSPAYNKISQIPKILHSGKALQRSAPRVVIKPRASLSATNVPSAGNSATSERKVIFRVVPMISVGTPASTTPAPLTPAPSTPAQSNPAPTNPAPTAPAPSTPAPAPPASVQSVPEAAFSSIKESTAQAIIYRAMATHRDEPKTQPIILSKTLRPKASLRGPSMFQYAEVSDQSQAAPLESPSGVLNEPNVSPQPAPAPSCHQVRVKRVSLVSERPSRKKSKMDFLKDPSSELDEADEARYSKIIIFCRCFYCNVQDKIFSTTEVQCTN